MVDDLTGFYRVRARVRKHCVVERQSLIVRRSGTGWHYLGGVNYFFRSRLSFLPVFEPHHRSTIGQSDAEGVRSSC